MNYTRYSRAVIVLEEKNREFAARLGEEVKGYLRVETGNGRGAFRCVMQNVKFFPRSEYTYQLILFGKRGERTIHTVLGTVPVSRHGTGEVYLRFRPQDVDGQGNDYSRYTTVIVAAVSTVDKREQLHPVLVGKTGNQEELPRASALSQGIKPSAGEGDSSGETPGQPQAFAAAETTAAAARTAVNIGADGDTAAVDAGGNTATAETTAAEAETAVGAALSEIAATATEPAAASPTVIKKDERRKTYNDFYGQYLKNVCAYLWSVPGYYRKVQPFSRAMKDAQWLKIDNPKSMFLVSPGAQYFAGKYGHFLLGAEGELEGVPLTYYVAVPGRFLAEDQPDGGESGFCYWLPVGEGGSDEKSYGYWIAAIDSESGEIFSPKKNP